MSDYIEDRIKRLETRFGTQAIDITAQQFSIKELTERVKALEEKLPTPLTTGYFKFGGTIDKKKFSSLEIGDPTDQSTEDRVKALEKAVKDLKEQMNILADDYKIFRSEDYVDQSTEEFVKVVRCKDCNRYDKMVGVCFQGICVAAEPDDYCSRGERK